MSLLSVVDQPKIKVHPKAETTTEGNNLILFCNATGNPVPTISWTKDGSLLSSNSRFSLSDDKRLTITNVNRTDSGEYRCVASNSLGNDTSSGATLNIQCKYSVKSDLVLHARPGQFRNEEATFFRECSLIFMIVRSV